MDFMLNELDRVQYLLAQPIHATLVGGRHVGISTNERINDCHTGESLFMLTINIATWIDGSPPTARSLPRPESNQYR